MRAMHNPWGIAALVISVVLVLLLVVSAIATLFALALFLVRRSRWVGPVSIIRST